MTDNYSPLIFISLILIFYCIYKLDENATNIRKLNKKAEVNQAILDTLYKDKILVPFEIEAITKGSISSIENVGNKKKPIATQISVCTTLQLDSVFADGVNTNYFIYKHKKISETYTANQLLKLDMARRMISGYGLIIDEEENEHGGIL